MLGLTPEELAETFAPEAGQRTGSARHPYQCHLHQIIRQAHTLSPQFGSVEKVAATPPSSVAPRKLLVMKRPKLKRLFGRRIGAGNPAQPIHRDQGAFMFNFGPKLHVEISTIWALNDFTAERGATVLSSAHSPP